MQACCPYLMFDGQADEAMRTYQRILGGQLDLLRYSQQPPGAGAAPPGCEPSDTNRVMHGYLQFPGGGLMCSDTPNSKLHEGAPRGMTVNLSFDDARQAREVYDQLADRAQQVRMPFGPTFWAEGFGMLVDRFGVPWMVGGGLRKP